MNKDQEISFTTDIEFKDRRVTVEVGATFTPSYSEQEYPGAHVWHNKASIDIESVVLVDDGTEIEGEISEANRANLEKAGFAKIAGAKPWSEFDEEDRIESLEAQRFEDMAYGPRDDEY